MQCSEPDLMRNVDIQEALRAGRNDRCPTNLAICPSLGPRVKQILSLGLVRARKSKTADVPGARTITTGSQSTARVADIGVLMGA